MKPMEFPLLFDKCPLCGCKKRVLESVGGEEMKKGKVGKDMIFSTTQPIALALVDPRKTVISALTLTVFRDICVDCGHEYVVCIRHKVLPWPPQASQQGGMQQILQQLEKTPPGG